MLTGLRNSWSLKNLLAFAHFGRHSREGRARTGGSPVWLRQDLIEAGTEFQVARRGEDPRFAVFLLR